MDRYIGNYLPGHLQFFSRNTVRTLLRATGFDPRRITVTSMLETVLEVFYGKGSSSGAAPSSSALLDKPGLAARVLGATRRILYGVFDILEIGSVMQVFAVNANSQDARC